MNIRHELDVQMEVSEPPPADRRAPDAIADGRVAVLRILRRLAWAFSFASNLPQLAAAETSGPAARVCIRFTRGTARPCDRCSNSSVAQADARNAESLSDQVLLA